MSLLPFVVRLQRHERLRWRLPSYNFWWQRHTAVPRKMFLRHNIRRCKKVHMGRLPDRFLHKIMHQRNIRRQLHRIMHKLLHWGNIRRQFNLALRLHVSYQSNLIRPTLNPPMCLPLRQGPLWWLNQQKVPHLLPQGTVLLLQGPPDPKMRQK